MILVEDQISVIIDFHGYSYLKYILQMMVQRVLAAKDLTNAQAGCLMCGVIKLLPLFVLVMPGLISRIMYPSESSWGWWQWRSQNDQHIVFPLDDVACSSPARCQAVCESPFSCSNIAYPKLVLGLMPAGHSLLSKVDSSTLGHLNATDNDTECIISHNTVKYEKIE